MNKTLLRSLFLFILTLPALAKAQTVPDKGLLYEVTGKGLKKPSYLFGTFHLLKSDYLSTMPKVGECFAKAQGLVVEVDLNPADIMSVRQAMVLSGKKISDFLTEEEEGILDAKLINATGLGLSFYESLKPAAIVVTLASAMPPDVKDRLEKYAGTMMDLYFMEVAREQKKDITGLETALEQANILFGDSLNKQVDNLKKYIAKADDIDTVTNKMVDDYFAQDLTALYKLSTDYNEYAGDMKKLLGDRNDKWMKVLPGLFKKQSQFVAVGALHLAGTEGLVYQLRKLGYAVKPLL